MNPLASSRDREPSPWVWPLLVVAAVAAVLLRLPLSLNFALVGAVAFFAGARLRSPLAYLVPVVVMGVSDLLLWWLYNYPSDWVVYVAFLLYVAVGHFFVPTRSPVRIFGGALAGSLLFFFITNTAAWWHLSVPPNQLYDRTFMGLLTSYGLAVPFYRNTLLSDLLFSGLLFGADALLSRYAPAGLFVRKVQP